MSTYGHESESCQSQGNLFAPPDAVLSFLPMCHPMRDIVLSLRGLGGQGRSLIFEGDL